MNKKLLFLSTGFVVLALVVTGCSTATQKTSPSPSKTTPAIQTKEDHPVKNLKLNYDDLFPDPDARAYAEKFIGKKATDFTLKNLKGETIQLSKFQGKNVVLELASTSCRACIAEEPFMAQFKSQHPELQILTVFPDDTNQQLEDFFKVNHYQRDDSMIAGQSENTIGQDYDLEYTPTILFIDKNGFIAFVNIGDANADALNKMAQLAFN